MNFRALGNATEAQAEFVADVYEAAVGQINQAVTATMGGIILSKSFMANITTNFPAVMEDLGESIEDSIDDAQDFVADSIDDAQDFVADAVEATSNATQEAASSLIYSMLSVKEQLHNMATNFSSQQAVNSGIFSIGLNLNATVTTAEGYASDFGIFAAMDDIVQMFGQIPKKINELLKAKYEFWISLISGQAEIDDIEENEENEDTEETTDAPIFDDDNNGEDTDARPRSSEFELNEEEGILRFLQGESRFWNQIREIINWKLFSYQILKILILTKKKDKVTYSYTVMARMLAPG